MVKTTQQRARYVKSLGIAAILLGAIFLSIEGYFIYQYWIRPRATNCFFHFNIQYRAGIKEIEDNIIQEPYYKLLKMFEKHPTWNFTIELQAAMIERIMETPEYEEILNLTRKLNHRGQMEILCGLYSSQLIHPYPQTVIEWNLKHAYEIFLAANLTRSRVLLCQEGQLDLGFANVLNESWSSGIDTLLVSWQQVQTYAPPGQSFPDKPVYTVEDLVPGKKLNLLVYDYLPKVEGGFMHSWAYWGDAEIAFELEDPDIEFTVDDNRLQFFEQQFSMLEREGNHFFTAEQWLVHCEESGAITPLDFYIPETHWAPTDYNSSFTWMGKNGYSDDGEMIANNRRGYFTVRATQIMYDYYKSQISLGNQTIIENLLDSAEKNVLLPMVTDTTGINPRKYERIYGESHIYNAMLNCSEVISIIVSEIPGLDINSTFQVDLLTQSIENQTVNFTFPTYNGQISVNDLPIPIEAWSSVNISEISVKNYSFEGFDYKSLEVTFPGSWDWNLNVPEQIELTFIVNASNLVYCPSLTDSINLTKTISRSNYASHPLYVFLPLSNGLIFIPNLSTPDKGMAIINNCSLRHTNLLWEKDYLKYLEIGGIHFNASYQIFFLEDVHLANAVTFAQRVNNHPPWIISDNISLMSGYSIYELYGQIANTKAGEGGL